MSGVEGIGKAVTGGMAARAVEPDAGEAAARAEPPACLNCGAALVGPYCHVCGQRGHVHRSIAAWWHEFVHGVLHLDGKFWRTLPMLAWRPGELTRRYVEGERARFVSPMAMFLFSVFFMFAVFSFSGVSLFGAGAGEAASDIQAEVRLQRRQVERLEAQRAEALAAGRDTAPVDARIEAARREIEEAESAGRMVEGDPFGGEAPRTGWARLDRGIEKAAENQPLLLYKIQNNAYKFSWALIPLSVPFVWLLFLHRRRYRRRFGAYDHLIFVTYSIAFISLLFVAFVLLRSTGLFGGWLNVALVVVPPLHIYRQLRGAYGVSRLGAAWRTLALLVLAGVAMALFFVLLLALGLLG